MRGRCEPHPMFQSKLIYFYLVNASTSRSVDSIWLKETSSFHQTYLPTVVKTVQQKNMEPKKSHRSGYCSQMDLKPVLIFCSSSTTNSSCVCLLSERDVEPRVMAKQYALLFSSYVLGYLLVIFCTICPRNSWYSSVELGSFRPSMFLKSSAPKAAYPTKDRLRKRCGQIFQRSTQHGASLFLPAFRGADIFLCLLEPDLPFTPC